VPGGGGEGEILQIFQQAFPDAAPGELETIIGALMEEEPEVPQRTAGADPGFFERLSAGGGVPPPQRVSSGIGTTTLGQVAEGFLGGATQFLGVKTRQAGADLERRQKNEEDAIRKAEEAGKEARESNRRTKREAAKRALEKLGENPLADNLDEILETANDFGREAGVALAEAVGISEEVYTPLLEGFDETGKKQRAAKTETLQFEDGRTIEVSPAAAARILDARSGRKAAAAKAAQTGGAGGPGITTGQARGAAVKTAITAQARQLTENIVGRPLGELSPDERLRFQAVNDSIRVELTEQQQEAGFLPDPGTTSFTEPELIAIISQYPNAAVARKAINENPLLTAETKQLAKNRVIGKVFPNGR